MKILAMHTGQDFAMVKLTKSKSFFPFFVKLLKYLGKKHYDDEGEDITEETDTFYDHDGIQMFTGKDCVFLVARGHDILKFKKFIIYSCDWTDNSQ